MNTWHTVIVIILTFTKSLAHILSRHIGFFLRYCSQAERIFQNHYPNPNISLHPNPNPNPNPHPNPNPSPRERNIRFSGWSRDQNSFLLITSRGSIFTLNHVGWFGISKQKYVDLDHQHRVILRTCLQKILKNLGERFSNNAIFFNVPVSKLKGCDFFLSFYQVSAGFHMGMYYLPDISGGIMAAAKTSGREWGVHWNQ